MCYNLIKLEKSYYCIAFRRIFVIHYQGHKVKEDKRDGACGMHGERNNACRTLVRKPKGKRLLERCRHKLADNIEIILKELK